MNSILIADDDTRMRAMLRQLLTDLAPDIYEAANGAEAMATYAMRRPDWVLMDVRMQPIDGLTATAGIKARFPDARIIIICQYDEPELRVEASRVGACAYVLKENLQELRDLLMAAELNPSGGEVQGSAPPTFASGPIKPKDI